MSSPLDITVEQAREIVLAESTARGWVRPELLHSQNPETQELLEVLRRIREELGDTVNVIAQGIYARSGRFILELIQNVEDCDFNHTDTPSISFEVSPEKIIVESNQDGFRAMDVQQICHTGRSWKRGRPGYVGEKGIGFKSVFKVASRVDIQSNAFSFYFEYNGGETGEERLGIITPILGDEPIHPSSRPLTRMTLALNSSTPYRDLVTEFMSIPETLLLFLSKIKEIKFKIYMPDQQRTAINTFRMSTETDGITSISRHGDSPQEWRYHLSRERIRGLPNDPARLNINECEIVLAFPIDEHGSPRIRTQHDVYAFLPVCTVGFNFILQADFLLQASREEVIVDSAWNRAILERVARVFCDAMVNLCGKHSLRFRWMRFLPVGRGFDMNPLWRNLASKVIDTIKNERILYLHDPSQLFPETIRRKPSDLRLLPESHLDGNGSPLFPDRPGINQKYLSLRYEREDVELLKTAFNLIPIEDIHMYHRIQQDLDSPTSIMMDAGTDAGWHSRAADLITSILRENPDVGRMIERDSALIPLNDGRWVTAITGDLFFPSRNGPAIPQDLVVTIDIEAAGNDSRRRMFTQLGVTNCQPAAVIERVWTSYLLRTGAYLDDSKAHLKYLYWHHANHDDRRFSRLWIYDSRVNMVACQHGLIYMTSDDEYGPQELLKAVPDPRRPNRLVPAYHVPYIHPGYIGLVTPTTRRHGLLWLDWLERILGVRRSLRLQYDAGALSPEFRRILQYRPEKIVGTLKRSWTTYREQINNSIKEEISEAVVTCLDALPVALSSTYFPLNSLRQRVQEHGLSRGFPFLAVPGFSNENSDSEDWRFLERFGVRFEANLTFYLDILRQHKPSPHQSWDRETRNGIIKTYELIADHCNEITRPSVVEAFHRDGLILDPRSFQSTSTTAQWLDTGSCMWRGPENLLDKTPLANVASYRNNRKVTRLFCEILGIRNANWKDYRDTLLRFRRGEASPPNLRDKIQEIYGLLSGNSVRDEDWPSLLNVFENESLIYVPSGPTWFPPSQCLWASPVSVPGKAILENEYPEEFQSFFQDHLNISPASLSVLVEGLCSLAQTQTSITDVKEIIWAINAMDPKTDDLRPLVGCNILPVRRAGHVSAATTLQNCGSNFAVIDRMKLADIFGEHVRFLDFSLEEVRQLDPFLQALDLNNNYLSRICSEETACDNDGVLDVALTEKFKDRAYHLLRCAVSNRSPLVHGESLSLYRQLLATSVLKTDSISTQFTIRYPNGDTVGPFSQNTGHVHIQEQDGMWKIFVPWNRDAREICYMRELPHALTKVFKINPSARENIGHVLNSSFAVIDELLEQAGIGEVSGIVPPPRRVVENLDEYGVDIGEEAAPSEASEQGQRVPERLDTPISSIFGEAGLRASPRHPFHPERSPSPQYPENDGFFTVNAYLSLLNNVIRIARRMILPRRDALSGSDNGQFHQGFDHDAAFGIRSQGQMNHDVKIGAAGELFVYECLKNIRLPSFDWSNWTSTIRKEVLIHPEYNAMGAWPGRYETSDITYKDDESVLTRYLINAGYLNPNVWADATPEYLIEVKTTTGDLSDRFYMSSNQYRMVQNLALIEGRVSERIYVIFRVYNLGRENLNVKIFVDPEAHRGRSLVFAEHTWKVTAR